MISIGEGINESKIEELIPKWGDEKIKEDNSTDKVKHNERSDRLLYF